MTRLLAEAERVDAEEDALHGKGKRGDELPKELKRREDRLLKIAKHPNPFADTLLGKALSRLTSGSRKQQCPRADPDPMPAP